MADPRPVCAAHVASRGPRFFRADESVMFEITLDHRSKIGPRPATEADSLAYPTAWKTFVDEELADKAAAEERERKALERIGKPVDVPEAKAEAERVAAERQSKMDAKRGRGV